MTVWKKRWARVTAALLVGVTLFACTNRSTDVHPTAVLPNGSLQATRILPTPIPRSTPLPSPVLLTPTVFDDAEITTVAPTVVHLTATSHPPAFSMPGADDAQATASSVPSMALNAADVLMQYAADGLGVSLDVLSAEKADSMPTLPQSVRTYVSDTDGLDEIYTAELSDGWAMVAFAETLADGDDHSALADRASLGVFVFRRAKPMPGNESAALAVVQATFPGLTDFSLQPVVADDAIATPVPGKLLLPTPPGKNESEAPRDVYLFGMMEGTPALTVVAGVASESETQFAVFVVIGKKSLATVVQP